MFSLSASAGCKGQTPGQLACAASADAGFVAIVVPCKHVHVTSSTTWHLAESVQRGCLHLSCTRQMEADCRLLQVHQHMQQAE